MAKDSEYLLEPLREDADFIFYRGKQRDSAMPILALAAEESSGQNLRRLEHEYSLACELDTAYVAQPLTLTRHQGRTVLIFKDPGGEPLDRVIEQHKGSIDLIRFLRIAIGLAAAVSQIHRQGVIHKDLKPANALVDESGHVWLTGFGVASKLDYERQAPLAPEIIAGTLAYMSPEQTGRMNRSMDARSDLYTLGVTLYEMLTGTLPFAATDPLEWVHCHIARKPLAPIDRRAVPKPLSDIIMHLLAKNAEERYQTAAGLEADLRRCLTDLQSKGRIDPFNLGADDSSDRLLIPEKLYGREREVEVLIAAFDRVVAQGTAELVLVSGYAGVGKSSVVNELQKVLVPPRALFAAGKFDQFKRDVPYATLAQAFQTLIHQILVKSEPEVAVWRHAFAEALGPNGQLIVNLIPELEFVVGRQPPLTDLPPHEARGRFQSVFRRFLAAFARPEHPLALFLDDLQWLDTATLELLEHLVADPELRHVLLIGAYRDNEVSSSHPLMRTLAANREVGAKTKRIVLSPLSLADVGRLVADALRCKQEAAYPLAELIHQKTAGNPFFSIQFLTSLKEEGLVWFERDSALWDWDLGLIRAKGYSDNVVDLMIGKLRRLSKATQAALQQLACLGNLAAIATLHLVFAQPEEEIHAALLEAVRAGLILRLEGSYVFLHDRIQEAAYALIRESERAQTHLQIGRVLVAHTTSGKLDDAVFEIVNQINRASWLVTAPKEREQLAEFNLLAGKRAQASSAYLSALNYLTIGAGLLTPDSWQQHRELSFALELARAHCELASGTIAEAEERLRGLSLRAITTTERVGVACLQVDLYQGIDRSDEAVAVGLRALRHLGIELPERSTEADARRAYDAIWTRLGARAIEDLIDLPLMSDPDSLATLDLMIRVAVPGFFDSYYLGVVAVCRAVGLGLERGHSDASCIAYAQLGMLAGAHFGQFDAGYRFGRLGCELVERPGLQRFQARTFETFGFVLPWTRHVREGREFLLRGFHLANQIGDISYAGYACGQLNTNYLLAGDPLTEAQRQAEHGLAFARRVGFGAIEGWIQGQLGLIRTLRGLTTRFGSFDDNVFREADLEHDLVGRPALALPACWYYIRKLQACFLAGEYADALQAASKAQPMLWGTTSTLLEIAEYHFYDALCHAAVHESVSTEDREYHRARLVEHLKKLDDWAHHCPENFATRAALVGAEVARIQGRDLDAEWLYETAISSANAADLVHNEALANELAARFYLRRGIEIAGYAYLRNARHCYDRWGAVAKVNQLDEHYPRLRWERVPVSTASTSEPAGQLDFETVVKASQALSSEMILPTLLERLMRIAVEHAGAQRSLLILIRDGEPRIEAEANTALGTIEVVVRQSVITPSDLPQSALHYVTRTRECVLLDDAYNDKVYSTDEYVEGKCCKSILCLPIVKQNKLVGALYFENNLSPGVFTPDRVTILQLLASQAAISLENATLYTDLQLQVGLLQHLPVSAWTLKPDGTPDFVNQIWLEFSGQTLDFVRSHPEAWMIAVHPEDREIAAKIFREGVQSGQTFATETRSLRAKDGVYRWHLNQGVPLRDANGKILKFVGTTTDIDDQKRTEEALRQAQSDLARINRATTMGELTASLAHEISQPISGAITNTIFCLRKLGHGEPDLDEVRAAVTRIAKDAQRAAEIIKRIRSQFERGAPEREILDVNEIHRETVALLRDEAGRYNVSVRTELASDLPKIVGDRVQLQQVAMNLIVNGIEAMKDVDGQREMVIQSQHAEDGGILVSISDTGVGISPQIADHIFDPFFTTKTNGTGMGLRICRSIIESHGGRLWAVGSQQRGATFHFSLPITVPSTAR